MGEIKSTLDLVMERTRHLQFSASERRQLLDKEVGAKLRGLLQKLDDQVLSAERFTADYGRLKSDYALKDDAALISESLGQLKINGDNRTLLNAMSAAAGVERSAIESTIGQFQSRYRDLVATAEQRLIEALERRHRISGTAVLPNLSQDEQWRRAVDALESEFKQKLSALYPRPRP